MSALNTKKDDKSKKDTKKKKPVWREATDKASGRTYYYNSQTRETTWTKPLELSDPEERKAREQAQANLMDFFHDMENNMRKNIKLGLNSSDVVGPKTTPMNNKGAAEQDNNPRTFSTDLMDIPHRVVRTISTVDDLVLVQAKRSESYGNTSPQSQARRKDSATNFFDLDDPPSGTSVSSPSLSSQRSMVFDKMSRRNSSSTIFVDSTMSMPDKEATIKCVCTVIRAHMLEAAKDGAQAKELPKASIFHDYEYLKAGPDFKARVPPLNELILFFRDLYTKSQMETECIIMSLIYMERLTKETKGGVQVLPHNWKSLLVSAMIMSSKVWDDLSMWNADFSQVCPSFTLKRINELELGLLEFLQYNVKVSASDYAKYYFHLRSYCVRLGLTHDLDSLAPLNLNGAQKLSVLSAQYQAANQRGGKSSDGKARCSSMPEIEVTSAGVAKLRVKEGSLAHSRQVPSASLEQVVHERHKTAGESS
mmetsp:Transcript_25390/g.30092  ORF Transcript_25390/g.30092 Transcript_25390/m.30092 type:complete len:479 (-) Transcript_25390:178-1614(-)|eukprot:CAMPEP_0114336178 /NCGR_PEP_ID=MMETSP0101-20121206/5533_1 /TAXON_ID=38822 ORGANISM="Pteridomonas danica, Strain PT" /NCGR_SAMPLE_ID=MMETSP0101 /ASSEMBLY_ACC=CAM_ASM_000211 /LENGTH=478 /DNA_ID=CAMNT_0001468013 /DNA_START=119 /DNA_END=1555 /DNA_ORIENTATION=+